jgi:hypothetical protein
MSPPHPALPDVRERREVAAGGARRQTHVDGEWTLVEFRPARWLLATLALLALWFVHPVAGKRALLIVAWRLTPRKLRLIGGGLAALALVVLAGSVAALLLVLAHVA